MHLTVREVYGQTAQRMAAAATGAYGFIVGIFLGQILCSLLHQGG